MKKYVTLIIFLICTSTSSYSSDRPQNMFNPLPLKKGEPKVVGLYNLWIKDYNKFKREFDYEVFDFCASQMIGGAGVRQYTQETKCIYNSAVDLAKKYDLMTSEVGAELYSHHKNLFPIAKTAAIAVLNCSTRSCQSRIINDYVTRWFQIDERLFRNLDNIVQKAASKHQADWIAKQKKKKDSGLDIADNEIVPASSGSGFFVSRVGHVISNNHVIEGCQTVNVIYHGKEFKANIVAVDKINDLAILKTDIRPEKVYSISKEDPQLLEQVIVAGYPLGKKVSESIKASTGTVTALAGSGDNYSEFQTDAALNSGNSGGPIIDNFGNVVGVAVSKIQSEGVEGFNFGVKSSILKIFANSNGLKFLPPNRREMKKKNLGNLITKGTVYIDCLMTGKQIKEIIAMKSNDSKKAFYSKFKK